MKPTLVFRNLLILALLMPAQIAVANSANSYQLAFSDDFTGTIVKPLEDGILECQAIAAVYQFDCYRQSYRAAGRKMNGQKVYRDAQKALRLVETTLKSIVKKNADKSAPKLKVNGKTYKAVKPTAVKPGAAAFKQARAEAVTILLRANGQAKVHYARIANVVGSNKLIIRSDLLIPVTAA